MERTSSKDGKGRIFEKAAELFMRYGIKSVTMDDIARELGISKKTIYQYVENKTELIEQIFQSHVCQETEAMRRIHEQSADAIEEILRIGQYVIQEFRQLSATLVYDLNKYHRDIWENLEAFHREQTQQLMRRNIEWGMRQGLYRPDVDADIVAKLYVGRNALLIDDHTFSLREYDFEHLIRQSILYHIHGIATPKGIALLRERLTALGFPAAS
jgi:AcrR family transcriptional regulator